MELLLPQLMMKKKKKKKKIVSRGFLGTGLPLMNETCLRFFSSLFGTQICFIIYTTNKIGH